MLYWIIDLVGGLFLNPIEVVTTRLAAQRTFAAVELNGIAEEGNDSLVEGPSGYLNTNEDVIQ